MVAHFLSYYDWNYIGTLSLATRGKGGFNAK
jgi:hypothetical protein